MEKRECMVCLDEFLTFITLPCKHEICVSCYPKIVQMNSVCPICRHDFKEICGEELHDVQIDDTPILTVRPIYRSVYADRRCMASIIVGGFVLMLIIFATHHENTGFTRI